MSILVQFGAVESASTDIAATADRVSATLEQLAQDLAPVTRNQDNWDGQTAQNYRAYQQLWDTAAADLNAVLRQIAAAVGTAHANYTAAEHANAGMWAL